MKRCLELAQKGRLHAAPNPMVGSVIVHDGQIIGEGYHQKYGEPHAEVNAVKSVQQPELLSKSTLYVNLEPCAHFGKTPPCSNLIIDKKIRKVVIGCVDSYSEVAGKGIEKMRKAGVEVEVGILEEESLSLNRKFFLFHREKRPFYTVKFAQTNDGYIDRLRTPQTPSLKITGPDIQTKVHQLRAENMGILVGAHTVLQDQPRLDNRLWAGNTPIRIVLDPNLTIPKDHPFFHHNLTTWVINSKENFTQESTQWIQLPIFNWQNINSLLYAQNMQSVLIEGGSFTIEKLIEAGFADEVLRYTNLAMNIKEGVKAPVIPLPRKNAVEFKNILLEIF